MKDICLLIFNILLLIIKSNFKQVLYYGFCLRKSFIFAAN